MILTELPEPLAELSDVVVPAVRRVYDLNANRHDELAGDDAVTFGNLVYRNSWYWLELEVDALVGWKSARPDGSLVISGHGYRIHVYRCGPHERLDLETFRLDAAEASATKRHIAETNGQLVLDLTDPKADQYAELRDLVILHAGNPEDGCCGIWIGAPVPTQELTISPWAWRAELWAIERPEPSGGPERVDKPVVRHDELPEPDIDVSPVEDEDDESTGEV